MDAYPWRTDMLLMNGRYGVIDLSSVEASEHAVPEGSWSDPSSYVSFIESVAGKHGGDALVVASGLLTCSFIPAACAGFVLSPRTGPIETRICPLTGYISTELKLSGFDFIVLVGQAKEPGYVWVRDGMLEFVPSPDIVKGDSWERTDQIRTDQGDRKIQVISVGPWGDAGLDSSQLAMNYWGGEDKVGCAADFGKKSLAALAVRGMGELELSDAEGHFTRSMELRQSHTSALGESAGLSSFTEKAAGDGFGELLHRKVSCYGCPYPCRSYYKIFEDAGTMALQNSEPGYLAYDIPGMESLLALGMPPREIVESLIHCARSGADPVAIASTVKDRGWSVSPVSIRSILSSKNPIERLGHAPEGGFAHALPDAADYVACLALGLCPRYWAKVCFDKDAISLAAEPAIGSRIEIR